MKNTKSIRDIMLNCAKAGYGSEQSIAIVKRHLKVGKITDETLLSYYKLAVAEERRLAAEAILALKRSFKKKNLARTMWARKALVVFQGGEWPDEADVRDLITGLMHLLHKQGRDPLEQVAIAGRNYDHEK
jgi:hypothetical protein